MSCPWASASSVPPRDKVAAFEVADEDIPQLTNPGVR